MDTTNNPQILLNALIASEKSAFDSLFRMYYTTLCRFANTITRSQILAEEAVQDTFVKLWEERKKLKQVKNIKSYLFKSVYNQCLWLVKKQHTQERYEQQYALDMPSLLNEEEKESWEAFKPHIQAAVNNLPAKCRQIFLLRRYEGLTNAEIADYLNISIKTVENQLTIAIQKLRKELHPFIKNLIILFFIENF
ncbi:RNA polymerase sigma-70 factor [Carboxylicivirga sp. RSCT41]|uniref:RNA polymerase sigma-70 factor n=1 Tax=Carboxylicivirga agarovorans TaxID=3417570 RepID=UPI003D3516F4